MAKETAEKQAPKEKLPRWDLTEYYTGIDDPQIKKDVAESLRLAKEFSAKYKGRIAELSGDELATALEAEDQLSYLVSKPGFYGSMLQQLKMDDSKVAGFNQSLSESINPISQELQFFGLELKKIDDVAMEEKYAGSEQLQKYKATLERTRAYRPHTLSDEVEGVLLAKSPTDVEGVLLRLFDEERARMRFEFRGEQLTENELEAHIDSPDQATRKEALQARSNGFADRRDIPTLIMNTIIKDKQIDDQLRNYDGDMASRNLSNNMETEVVNALVDTVMANYEQTSHRENKLRAQLLGQESLAEWDSRGPLPDKSEKYIPWKKAEEIVVSSYREFSPVMADIAQKFFDEGWIDAAPSPGKNSGAFSAGGMSRHHPHVLMNYQGKPRDVMTLAHELGHGIHQYLENATQGDITPGTPLTIAETASIFGEELVFNKLLSEIKDPTEKKVLLAEKVADGVGTIVRQASWIDFERKIHEERKNGELSSDRFAELWNEVNIKREGPAMKERTEKSGDSWHRVPHMFHTPFYMYAYSCGNLFVNSLFKAYEEGKVENFDEKLVEALKAGGTKHHSELLEPFGLDARKPSFWQKGMDVLIHRIDQLEEAIAEEKAFKAGKTEVKGGAEKKFADRVQEGKKAASERSR